MEREYMLTSGSQSLEGAGGGTVRSGSSGSFLTTRITIWTSGKVVPRTEIRVVLVVLVLPRKILTAEWAVPR
jgi:hypothetical protein